MSVNAEVFQEVIGEVVRENEKDGKNLSKEKLEEEVRKYIDFDQQQRFDGNFISARDNREFIGSKDEYGNVIEPGEGGEHQGAIVDVWFNPDLNKESPLVDLSNFKGVEEDYTPLSSIISDYEEFYNSPRHSDEEYKWRNVREFQEAWEEAEDKSGEDFYEVLKPVIQDTNLLGWRGKNNVKRKFNNDAEGASESIKRLVDEDEDIVERFSQFRSFFEMPNAGGTKVASYFLASLYPEKYVFFKYEEDKKFLENFGVELNKDFDEYESLENGRIQRYLDFNEKMKEVLEEISLDEKNLWNAQDLIWYYSQYWMPEDLKSELDSIKKNGGSAYTRLFALKCFFEEQDEGSMSGDEFDKVVKEKAEKMELPGKNKSAYIRLNYNVFRNYEPFTASDDKYGVKEEYHEYLDAMAHYVNYLWNEVSSETNYFVVSHNENPEELEEGYLRASYTEEDGDSRYEPGHDLSMLSRGDTILHYKSKKFVGYSKVESEPEVIDTDNGEEFYLEVDINRFDNPRHLDDVADVLEEESDKVDKYYALASNRTKSEGYLRRLTERGAKHIINFQKTENYFWITAHPSIWEVSELDEGDKKFYPAYLPSGNKARIFSNFEKASEGDKVVFYQSTPVKKVVAEGIVSEGIHEEEVDGYDSSVEGITVEYRREIEGNVSWSKLKEIPDLEDSKPIINTAQGSIFKLKQEEFETILSLENPEPPKGNLGDYTQTPEFNIKVPDDLYFENESELQNEIEASLNSGKNIIFTGPPGTGKTKLAKSISEQVSGDEENVEGSVFTTATADWTAFDTIGGYMPSQSDGEELEFNPGQFLKCFRKENGEVTNKWLVIDEINRSDIDKAFGQLFSVLSGDSVELPYRKDGHVKLEKVDSENDVDLIERDEDIYPITDSWRLIATMNTYDKTSLYDMSYAFMRRFNFIHVGVPELETEEGYNYDLLDPEEEDNYASVWDMRETLAENDLYKDLTVLWAEVNNQRDIGPSIIKDIIEFIDAHSGERDTALAQAVNSLILPQFEGLRREKQEQFIKELNNHSEEGSISINDSLVEEKALNMFSISLEDE
ncbi:MAG: AAA family ATPase [Candidatus Nanohalobium sp.]